MKSVFKRPTLDTVTTINEDGSRFFLHPADVKGGFTLARRLTAVLLIGVYLLLPWIRINSHPAVFLDVSSRRFHLFGLTFLAQDAWFLFFVISGLGFSLFFVTALFGRLWCGWACPYTVFLEHVFRRIERWIEGDAPARRLLDAAPWSAKKIFKRVLKHGLFLLCSAVIAHAGLSYFVSLEKLYVWMRESPARHLAVFSGVTAYTVILYFCFGWFREQFCIVLCPYGRLQSALTDDDTMVIGYDRKRGEPRGKATDPNAGDCVDCQRCVQVCPAGIDIRNGLQMECIGCAACVDACGDIMRKLKRPAGLVRYDSLNGLAGKKRRFLRPRVLVYGVLLLAGATAAGLGVTRIHSFEMSVVRLRGLPFMVDGDQVRNQFILRLLTKRDEEVAFRIGTENAPPGLRLSGADGVLVAPGQGETRQTLMMTVDRSNYTGPFRFHITATPVDGGETIRREVEFLGPDPRLFSEPAEP